MSAPSFIEQGSSYELIVTIRAPRGARRVDFTVSADQDFVELREATPGQWGIRAGVTPVFEARIDEVANRLAIRAEGDGELPGNETLSVAIVRFEGVAPGSATLTVSGFAVRDRTGAGIPVASLSATAQVVVMSGPI